MRKSIIGLIAFSAAGLMLLQSPGRCGAQTQATQTRLSDLALSRFALMPFLMGQLESPDAPIAKPLSKSLTQADNKIRFRAFFDFEVTEGMAGEGPTMGVGGAHAIVFRFVDHAGDPFDGGPGCADLHLHGQESMAL